MTQAQKLADLSQAFTAGSLGFRNLLLNAEGRINQRGYASGAAIAAANQYTVDRWRVVVSGQSLVIGAGIGSARQFTAPAGGVEQVIESVNITGGTYCLNWVGSATATVNGVAVPQGGNFTLPAETNATVRFTGGTFTQPQFEIGGIPTTFDWRPAAIEEIAARRYYMRWKGDSGLNYQLPVCSGVANSAFVPLPLVAPMRAAPSMLSSGVVAANYSGGVGPGSLQWTMGVAGVTYSAITGGAMSVGLVAQSQICGLVISGMSLSNVPNFLVMGGGMWIEASAEL